MLIIKMDNNELPDKIYKPEYDLSSDGRHRRHHRHSSSRRWIYGLLIALVIESIILASALIWGTKLQEESKEHLVKEKELLQEVKDIKTELEKEISKFNKFKSEQVKMFPPNLLPLEYNKVLEINNEYVKSGIFMVAGKKDKKYLEFKLILQNTTQDNILPKFEVWFYNTAGNKLGLTQLGYHKDEPAPAREILEKGEIRAYDGIFEINNNDGQPEYLMIKLKNAK
jgi:hypothetical protein